MKRKHLLISSAWLLHTVSWFLPVIKSINGSEINPGVRGWLAFVVASCSIRPHKDTHFDAWYGAVLAGASVITTVFFVLGSPWVVLRGSPSLRRVFAWAAAAAFVVNAHWFVLVTPGEWRSDLGIGYFLWWFSFLVLAIGLFDLSRKRNIEEGSQPPTASQHERLLLD
jgi:hypothetical protein